MRRNALSALAGLGSAAAASVPAVEKLLADPDAQVRASAAGALGGSLSWQGWAILISAFVVIGLGWHITKLRRPGLLVA